MRFHSGIFIALFLCSAAHRVCAEERLPAPLVDHTNPAVNSSAEEPPAVIEADSLEGKSDDRVEAAGNVTLRQGNQAIHADRLIYQQDTREVDAHGAVKLEQEGSTMAGDSLNFNMGSGVGTMARPQYYLEANDGRGTADALHLKDRQHFTLENATYTTCQAENQDWQMKMGLLEVDRDRQIGVAHNAIVEFKNIPFLYAPWMDFPLNNQRKSGFLAPIFGGTSKGGTEMTLPFYWNMADNRDATIAPRYIQKRGLMLNNEFRYLQAGYGGEINIDVLHNDAITSSNRQHLSLQHNQNLSPHLNGYVDYSRVWDDAYYRDLGNAVNTTSLVNLPQEGGASFFTDSLNAVVRVQRYQTLQDPAAPIVAPYARWPQMTVNAQEKVAGATFAMAGEYVDFRHPDLLNASRLVLNPGFSYPLVDDPAYYVTPRIALHHTRYVMGENNVTALPNITRTLPIFSVDSGFSLERDSSMFGGQYLQTFEPRVFYVYIPYRDQSHLYPHLFDTAQADFNFTQMFTENRFIGNDLIGDANQITLAATSRLLDRNNGAERLKVMLGERFSFKSPQVNLAAPTTSTGKSDILLAAAGQVTRSFSLDSEVQFDPNESHAQRYNLAAHYRPEAGKTMNFGYRFQRNTLRQADLSTQWPLLKRWHAVGRLNYSFPDNRILDSIAGLEYNQDCWTLRLVAQHFTTATQQTNTGFFVQLELNGFMKVGADPLALLKQSVPGYTPLSDQPVHTSSQTLQ